MCKEIEEAIELATVMNEEFRLRATLKTKEIELNQQTLKLNHELNLKQLELDMDNIDKYSSFNIQKEKNSHIYKLLLSAFVFVAMLILSFFVYQGRFQEIKDLVILIITAIVSYVGGYGMSKKQDLDK